MQKQFCKWLSACETVVKDNGIAPRKPALDFCLPYREGAPFRAASLQIWINSQLFVANQGKSSEWSSSE